MKTNDERERAIQAIAECLRRSMPTEKAKAKPAGNPTELDLLMQENERSGELIDRIETALRLIFPRRRFIISREHV